MRLRTSLLAAAVCTALMGTAGIASAQVSIGISVHLAPPAIPVYEQPDIPAPGYLWVPGYWAWSNDGDYYYWVPGTWVLPPQEGLLWTPGYWGWSDGAYVWHEGYWGGEVGFYGGVDYGFGYGPNGYEGGYWRHGQFYYNTAVNRVPPGLHLRYVYRHPVPGGGAPGRASFNGGRGGIQLRPTAAQLSVEHERHVTPIGAQRALMDSARHDQQLRADYNHGHPGVAATPRPEAFGHPGGEVGHAPPARTPEAAGAPGQGLRSERGPQRSDTRSEGGAAAEVRRGPAEGFSHAAPAAHPSERPAPRPDERANFATHGHVPVSPREATHPAPTAAPHVSPAGSRGGAEHAAPPGGERRGGGKPNEQRDQHPPGR